MIKKNKSKPKKIGKTTKMTIFTTKILPKTPYSGQNDQYSPSRRYLLSVDKVTIIRPVYVI